MLTNLSVTSVKHVLDGSDAVSCLASGEVYDVIFMDNEMPVLNGSCAGVCTTVVLLGLGRRVLVFGEKWLR